MTSPAKKPLKHTLLGLCFMAYHQMAIRTEPDFFVKVARVQSNYMSVQTCHVYISKKYCQVICWMNYDQLD